MKIDILWRPAVFLCRWRVWGLAGVLFVLSLGTQAGSIIDFSYKIVQGGTPLRQVYDDGTRTYLVLAGELGAKTPWEMPGTVRAVRDGKVYLTTLDLSSPTPSLVGVYDHIVVTFGGRRASATYVGKRGPSMDAEVQSVEEAGTADAGQRYSIRKTPVPEPRTEGGTAIIPPANARMIDRMPVAKLPPSPGPVPEIDEILPSAEVEEARPPAIGKRSANRPLPMQPAPADREPLAAMAPAPVDRGPQAALAPIPAQAAGPVQKAAVPPADNPVPETRETLPNNQVVKVVARTEEAPPPVPVAAAADPRDGADGAEGKDVAEYKVMVPFAMGKTVLGKDGEKAMGEVTQIGPIAKEIRIRAPGDPGSLQRAHGRAAEIHKILIKAGLLRQRISIEAVNAVPEGKTVNAEVALIVDLPRKTNK